MDDAQLEDKQEDERADGQRFEVSSPADDYNEDGEREVMKVEA